MIEVLWVMSGLGAVGLIVVAVLRAIESMRGDMDFWPWTRLECERRKHRRRFTERVAQHMAAGMSESSAREVAAEEFGAESTNARKAWKEATA